jgi:hypothetical protein
MDLYNDDKWSIRAEHLGSRLVFYVDGPDEPVDDIFPWERYLNKNGPNFLFGTYRGVPEAWKESLVYKQHCPIDSPAEPFFFAVDLEPSLDMEFVECRADSKLFYETLRRGCVPVLTANDTKLPLDGFVDWDEILVHSSEEKELAAKKARQLSVDHFSDAERYIAFCNFLSACNDGSLAACEPPEQS